MLRTRLRDERRPRLTFAHAARRASQRDRKGTGAPSGPSPLRPRSSAANSRSTTAAAEARGRGVEGRGAAGPRIWTHAARGLRWPTPSRPLRPVAQAGHTPGPSVRAGSGWRGRFGRPHPFDGHQPEAHGGGARGRRARPGGRQVRIPHGDRPRTGGLRTRHERAATASPASSRSARGVVGFSIPRSVEATHLISPGRRKVRDRTTPAGRSESFLLGFFPRRNCINRAPTTPPHQA